MVDVTTTFSGSILAGAPPRPELTSLALTHPSNTRSVGWRRTTLTATEQPAPLPLIEGSDLPEPRIFGSELVDQGDNSVLSLRSGSRANHNPDQPKLNGVQVVLPSILSKPRTDSKRRYRKKMRWVCAGRCLQDVV
jgi:hypothetical protein